MIINKNRITKIFLALFVTLSSSLTFIEKTESAVNNNGIVMRYNNGDIDWTNKLIRVKGEGIPPDNGGIAQKRLKARLAARTDAYRKLAEVTNGVQVTAESKIGNFVTESDVIKLKVDAVIKGARQ